MANQPTARKRSLLMADMEKARLKYEQSRREFEARQRPVTATLAGYDPVSGSYLVETLDGGTIRAQNLGDGAPVGLRLSVQRFADSQTSSFLTRPSRNAGNNVSQVEAMGQGVVNLLATQERTITIQGPTVQQYPLMAVADRPYRYEGLAIVNRNGDGSAGTAGTATVLVNGTAAVAGETIIPVGGYVAVNVTNVGSGTFMSVSVYARLV